MAFTGSPVKSNEYTNQTASHTKVSVDVINKLELARFSYTHAAGAGTGEVNLIELPAGRITVYPDLSRLVTTAFAANSDIHIGYRAYVGSDGVTVVEDDNAFVDNGDAGGGALDTALVLPAAGFHRFDSRNGVLIYAMVDTGNIEDTDTIGGWIAFVRG